MEKLFHIFKIDGKEAEKISSKPDEPHKHNFEELIIVVEGQIEHFIDFQTKTLNAPIISFVTKGKPHRVIPKSLDGKCDIWVIRFKSEFIAESAFHFYALFHNNATIELKKEYCYENITSVCQLLYNEYQQELPNFAVIKQMLSLIFNMIEAQKEKDEEHMVSQNTTFKIFLSILEENYHRPLGVEFYAEKLFMTVRNLNRICQATLDQSVSEIIEARKLIEAKNQLLTTKKTIAEIGYELGYSEKSYFTNVFKKKAGITPTEFREEMKKMLHS
jgi:AraC-like DNA-binding protein